MFSRFTLLLFHHWRALCQAAPWWLFIVLLAGSLRGQAQAVRSEHRASLARVQALLGPPPAGEAASWAAPLPTKVIKRRSEVDNIVGFRAERQQLLARRQQWAAEPLAFVVWARLAVDAASEQLPDTAVVYLRRALAANRQVPGYALDAAGLNRRLSNYYWNQQAHDSALACHQREIRALQASGLPTSSPRPTASLTGDSLSVGISLAKAYANAGLALRRRGDYAGAVRAYAQGRRHYQQLNYLDGLIWLEELLGEAYDEQGNDEQARLYYAAARRTAHAMQATEPTMAAVSLAEVLDYSHALLLRQHRAPELLRLLTDGIATTQQAWQRDTAYWRLAGIGAGLHLRAAEVLLRTRQPGAAEHLRRAAQGLAVIARRAPTPPLRRHFHYYERRAEEQVLCHWLARATTRPPDPVGLRRALTYADSLDSPAEHNALRLRLADYLLQAGDPAPAAALLPAAEASYRAARNRLKLRDVYQLEAKAYAALGRWQPAYRAKDQLGQLTDSLRAAQQYAALADVETRYRTQQKEMQIAQLQEHSVQEQRQKWLAWTGAALLALLLGGAAWVLRRTRRLNRDLAAQQALLAAQAEQLTELDRAKSAFFANVSHELRTPLTLIVGPVEHLLRQGAAAWEPTLLRERLTMTLRNGRRLQGLVNGLLDFSKLDAGKLVVHPMVVQAADFFRHLISLFESLAQERGVALRGTVALPDELTLLFDADKAEKVVTNLLANALKFTPPGGQVAVTVAPDPAVADEYQVTVADTGPGIAPQEQARVFERFYQSRAHQVQGGTGIGLALSRELAELLGGQLTLHSREGEGSTFCFSFRVEPTTDPAPSFRLPETALDAAGVDGSELAEVLDDGPDLPAPDGPRPRILVVEDHADLRAYLRQILQPHYEVLEAENGRVALEVLAREPVDLISSDAMMPELGGIELLQHMKAHPEWRRLPFLMLTARASAEHRLSALELGVDDYLPKPFLAHELLVRVGNLLTNYHERLRWLAAPEPEPEPVFSPESETVTSAPQSGGKMAVPDAVAVATEAEGDEATHSAALLRTLHTLVPDILANPDYTPELLSTALHLSERTAYRRLKELTGLTPAGWLREARLDRARQLLEAQMLPTVAEVAYEVGFPNASHFTQLYTKRFGKKPSEY